MKTIGIIQQKGGVGKTTIAVNLAHQIKEFFPSAKVALLDTDPQQSAFKWVSRGSSKEGQTPLIRVVKVLLEGEGESLRRQLKELNVDIAIIDCPPAIEATALKTALASDLMLVPICASSLDIDASKKALGACFEAIEMDARKLLRIIPNKVQLNTSAGRELKGALSALGPVMDSSLGLRVDLADSVGVGQGINTYAKGSTAHKEIKKLAKEVCELLALDKEKRA